MNFIQSFVEVLPLVEFTVEDGISDEEAVRLIESPVPSKDDSHNNELVQTLQLDDDFYDPFTAKVLNFEVWVFFVCFLEEKKNCRIGVFGAFSQIVNCDVLN